MVLSALSTLPSPDISSEDLLQESLRATCFFESNVGMMLRALAHFSASPRYSPATIAVGKTGYRLHP